ncbi:MAG: HDOD domain-containing protein [Gallionellaceae bacterium]|nr:HDOD domain-containing protein [Gallionellaceae bacterium]
MGRIDKDTQHRLLTTRLPALPQVLLRLLELCRQEDSGLDDIAKLIGQEPALSAKLLTLACSADRHGRQAPRSLLQALMQLGLDSARTAVIGESIQQVFNGLVGNQEINLGVFWQHSLGAAILAKRLARAAGYPHVEEAYLAGLLHDVGQLAMLATFPSEYHRAFAEGHDDTWLSRWEENVFGFTHAEVGTWLAARWQLDGFLADALLYHHEAAEQVAQAHPLVRIVWLAHVMEHDDQASLPDLLECGEARLSGIRGGVADEVKLAADLLGIRLADPEAQPEAQASLTEEVRGLALIGALRAQAAPAPSGVIERLRSTAHTARILFELGDCLFYQVEGDRLRSVAPWPHLARGEELAIMIGDQGGCIGRAAASGRPESILAAELGANLVDKQLLRLLGQDHVMPALLAIPLGSVPPCPVLVFAARQTVAANLLARPPLLQAFADVAAARLLPSAAQPTAAPGLSDPVRRAVHEASNPLGIIKNYLRILTDELGARSDAGELVQDLALVDAEIDRVSRILRNLVQPDLVAPVGAARPRGSDLNRAVRELLAFCRDTYFIPDGIRVESTLQDGLPAVLADQDSLKQIVLNLLKNGIEALGTAGRIVMSTTGPLPRAGGRFVVLLVSDNGPGLPQDVQAGLFSPVETHKGAEHSGLGLAIVGELVERLGGQIEWHSAASGTAFQIFLPAAPAPGETT